MIFDDSAYICISKCIFERYYTWSSKYYYSLIGVPKMDTWQGCDDLSLDRSDPWGTEDRPQSQAPLSISIAAPSAHNLLRRIDHELLLCYHLFPNHPCHQHKIQNQSRCPTSHQNALKHEAPWQCSSGDENEEHQENGTDRKLSSSSNGCYGRRNRTVTQLQTTAP